MEGESPTWLLFTDTYSLMYEIKTEDLYEDFSNDKEMFDVSNYLKVQKYIQNILIIQTN